MTTAGRTPTWSGSGGPERSVDRLIRVKTKKGTENLLWYVALDHVKSTWGFCHTMTGGSSLDFGAMVARHVRSCYECQQPSMMTVWGTAMKFSGTSDVIRAFRKAGFDR